MSKYVIERDNELIKKNEMEFFYFSIGPHQLGAFAHIHDLIEILLIDKGSFEITCDETTVTTHEGDMVLFRSNTIHKTNALDAEENAYWVLKISPKLLITFLPKDMASNNLLWFSVGGKSSKILWTKDELQNCEIPEGFLKLAKENKNPDQNSELAIKIAAATVILGILRKRDEEVSEKLESSGMTELIYKAIVYVSNNYALPITAEELSRELNVSYSYFSRSFKRIMGVSFRQHLNAVRINYGESLLKNTDYSVSKISELCGFESVSHFISTYRKLKNSSPLQDRKEGRK